MAKILTIRLRGPSARVAEKMVRAGTAETLDEAVHVALMRHGQAAGLTDEKEQIAALRRQAAEKPLSDAALSDGIRRAKGARLPRR